MAIVKVLSNDFKGNGLNAPKLTKIDRLESTGSLLLFEPSRSLTQVPANNGILPNLFNEQAKVIVGVAGDTNGIYKVNTATPEIKAERTAKGGLHLMTRNVPNASSIQLDFGAPLRDYVANLASPNIYFSVWKKMTRNGSGVISIGGMYSTTSATANYYFLFDAGHGILSKSGSIDNQNGVSASLNSAVLNAKPTLAGSISHFKLAAGSFDAWTGFMTGSNDPSFIVYRVYMENLAISGRTYDQVKALDKAYFDECFATGGKYAGDTHSDPLTAF